ncbi:unnamed protein product [Candida verbasci]|uniref:Formamidopyrimidine-DNA glycosylase catalytic domain-containing protein n=1 Tax=Candida verbasci TaxID=1227364 RepID=A0A9W4XFM7_9ASCO|nr:unnamed protein product [Candida verbasci]
MPEVSEVSHTVAQLRRNIIGYTISKINYLVHDSLLFPIIKTSTDPESELVKIEQKLLGSHIESVGRHGKYFWIRFAGFKIMLMHFGMTGMIKIRNIASHLKFMENGGDKKLMNKLKTIDDVKMEEVWPPRFTKLELELKLGDSILEMAFTDPRRLGRIRLLENLKTDEELLKTEPLNVLGPDYSKSETKKEVDQFVFGDPDPNPHGRPRLGINEFNKLILSKKKSIKSLLLDQCFFAGVGNWVADEVLFHSKLHPSEIISNKIEYKDGLIDEVVKKLYDSLIYVCETAVDLEGDVTKFPKHWLMIHRWGKGRKKEKSMTLDGLHLDHITVGGRTACYCPESQKLLSKKPKMKEEEDTEKPKPKRRKVEKEIE